MSSLENWLSRIVNLTVGEDPAKKFADVQTVLARLELGTLPFVITVAGTNGKGSVVALLSSTYYHTGYRVGAFTSPHLLNFNERISINGTPVSDEEILKAFEKVEAARGDIKLGYFQFIFLAAMIIFQNANLDLVILEVGIGGRYDAVNTIDADLAVITEIGFDHCELLGYSLESIAKEKAGIMRLARPVVIKDTQLLNQFVKEKGALSITMQVPALNISGLLPENEQLALTAIHYLQHQFPVNDAQIKKGFLNYSLKGRQQLVMINGHRYLFDVAHNVDGVRRLAKRITELNIQGQCHLIFGVMADKAVDDMIDLLKPVVDEWWLLTINTPRALSVEKLKQKLLKHGIKAVYNYKKPFHLSPDDLIVVTGSFLTVQQIWRTTVNY